jgi:hypothetical protein
MIVAIANSHRRNRFKRLFCSLPTGQAGNWLAFFSCLPAGRGDFFWPPKKSYNGKNAVTRKFLSTEKILTCTGPQPAKALSHIKLIFRQ